MQVIYVGNFFFFFINLWVTTFSHWKCTKKSNTGHFTIKLLDFSFLCRWVGSNFSLCEKKTLILLGCCVLTSWWGIMSQLKNLCWVDLFVKDPWWWLSAVPFPLVLHRSWPEQWGGDGFVCCRVAEARQILLEQPESVWSWTLVAVLLDRWCWQGV